MLLGHRTRLELVLSLVPKCSILLSTASSTTNVHFDWDLFCSLKLIGEMLKLVSLTACSNRSNSLLSLCDTQQREKNLETNIVQSLYNTGRRERKNNLETNIVRHDDIAKSVERDILERMLE